MNDDERNALVPAAQRGEAHDPVLSSAALAQRLHKALRQQTREKEYWKHRALEAESARMIFVAAYLEHQAEAKSERTVFQSRAGEFLACDRDPDGTIWLSCGGAETHCSVVRVQASTAMRLSDYLKGG